jgi:hypothetical protein
VTRLWSQIMVSSQSLRRAEGGHSMCTLPILTSKDSGLHLQRTARRSFESLAHLSRSVLVRRWSWRYLSELVYRYRLSQRAKNHLLRSSHFATSLGGCRAQFSVLKCTYLMFSLRTPSERRCCRIRDYCNCFLGCLVYNFLVTESGFDDKPEFGHAAEMAELF